MPMCTRQLSPVGDHSSRIGDLELATTQRATKRHDHASNPQILAPQNHCHSHARPNGPTTISRFRGDSLEVLSRLPKASVDLILADLPYGTTACAWDSPIPLEPLWKAYAHVMKPTTPIVLTAVQPFAALLVVSKIAWIRYEWDLGKAARHQSAERESDAAASPRKYSRLQRGTRTVLPGL